MLDQNTDRMWFVIGAMIIGAAIIGLLNGTVPHLFASIGNTFDDKVMNVDGVVNKLKPGNLESGSDPTTPVGGSIEDGVGPVTQPEDAYDYSKLATHITEQFKPGIRVNITKNKYDANGVVNGSSGSTDNSVTNYNAEKDIYLANYSANNGVYISDNVASGQFMTRGFNLFSSNETSLPEDYPVDTLAVDIKTTLDGAAYDTYSTTLTKTFSGRSTSIQLDRQMTKPLTIGKTYTLGVMMTEKGNPDNVVYREEYNVQFDAKLAPVEHTVYRDAPVRITSGGSSLSEANLQVTNEMGTLAPIVGDLDPTSIYKIELQATDVTGKVDKGFTIISQKVEYTDTAYSTKKPRMTISISKEDFELYKANSGVWYNVTLHYRTQP